eukprot:jgi/Mesvir1/12883/Mv05909-RA.1
MAAAFIESRVFGEQQRATGRNLDPALDNNRTFPVTPDQLEWNLSMGARMDPSLHDMRKRGGVNAANGNTVLLTDERFTSPFLNTLWPRLRKESSRLDDQLLMTNLRPTGAHKYSY